MTAPLRGNQAQGLLVFEEVRVVLQPSHYQVWVRVGRRPSPHGDTVAWRYREIQRTVPLTTVWGQMVAQAETWDIVPDDRTTV